MALGLRDGRRRAVVEPDVVIASYRAAERVVVRPIVGSLRGTLVKHGDGWIFLAFTSVVAAMQATLAVQRTLLTPVDAMLRRRPLTLDAAIDVIELDPAAAGMPSPAAFARARYLAEAGGRRGLVVLSRTALGRLRAADEGSDAVAAASVVHGLSPAPRDDMGGAVALAFQGA